MPVSSGESHADTLGRELKLHGQPDFPAACYAPSFPADDIPPHWHEEIEFILVEKGRLRIYAESVNLVLEEGAGVFINANILHTAVNDGAPARIHSVVASPSLIGGNGDSVFWKKFLDPLLNDISHPFVILERDVPWQAKVLEHIGKVWTLLAETAPGYEIHARNFLSLVVLELSAHRDNVPSAAMPEKRMVKERRLKTMLEYIHTYYSEDISVVQIAAAASVSKSECLRCFKSGLGVSPMQYVIHHRLKRAAGYLKTTGWPVSEIGMKCGFMEMGYFAARFKEAFGFTPSEYRRRASAVRRRNTCTPGNVKSGI